MIRGTIDPNGFLYADGRIVTTKGTKSTKDTVVCRGNPGHPQTPSVDLHAIGRNEDRVIDELECGKMESWYSPVRNQTPSDVRVFRGSIMALARRSAERP